MQVEIQPRANSKCKVHTIPEDVEWVSDELYPTEMDLTLALEYLRNIDADLIAGDVVFFEKQSDCYGRSIGFFDGEKFVELGGISEFGSLPDRFHVIENGVPIKYWSRAVSCSAVHFNHVLVREECIKNAKYGYLQDGKYSIFTTFTFRVGNEEKTYTIAWDYHYVDDIDDDFTCEINSCTVRTRMLHKFVNVLSSDEPIFFSFVSEYDIKNHKILYISI
jgi:hypothetical protein